MPAALWSSAAKIASICSTSYAYLDQFPVKAAHDIADHMVQEAISPECRDQIWTMLN